MNRIAATATIAVRIMRKGVGRVVSTSVARAASGLLCTGECQSVSIGQDRSTDDVIPQQDLTYEVFADDTLIGTLIDNGHYNGLWKVLPLPEPGPNTITAKAVDAAGNRSIPSNAQAVTGYAC